MLRNSIVILVLALIVSFVACQEEEVILVKEKTTTQKEHIKKSEVFLEGLDDLEKAVKEMQDGDAVGVYMDSDNRMQIITGTEKSVEETFAQIFPNNSGYAYANSPCEGNLASWGSTIAFIGCVIELAEQGKKVKIRLDGLTLSSQVL